ncbi:aminopeptidase [Gottschalkia purinilytica]|uniref:Aminopeptidase n=1 Tax=Gottschalkia purinilytica TaxID=1503 RepID=A0A0L0W9E1_GOTPU|nr:M28 family metallopeptidase [Gottschalkia purinilytica]KNF08173.1 aminopeptidase [Gottschalkia purinilytica]
MRNKKRISILVAIVLVITLIIGYTNIRAHNARNDTFKNIDVSLLNANNIYNTIKKLTSKKYDGRLVGTAGNELATEYIINHFKNIGLKSPDTLKDFRQNYKQNVRFTNKAPVLNIIDDDGKIVKQYDYLKDFSVATYFSSLSISGSASGKSILIEEVKDFAKDINQFEDKVVLVSKKAMEKTGFANLLSQLISNKIKIKGIIYEVDLKSEKDKYSTFVVGPNAPPIDNFVKNGPMLFMAESETFRQIAKLSKENMDIHMAAYYSIENVKASNVIGAIEGNDKKLKDEYIIIGAHFDHVGDNKNGTYNPGALDNASGTSVMMEIARVLKENRIKPKKTIIFIGYNGEEEGLYGSKHYVYNPVYPLNEKTKVINLDMVGSKRKVPLELVSYDARNVKLRNEFLKYSRKLGIESKAGVSQGSDHASFAAKNIDAVTLIHMDLKSGYHTPKDTIDNIDKNRAKEAAKVVLYYLDKYAY